MTRYHVYHLVDPDTRAVMYVGKSTAPKARHRQHIQESQVRQNTAKKRWIHRLLAAGKAPVLIVVADFATESAARTHESAECHRHKATILNLHDPAKGAKALRPRAKSKAPA